LYLLANWIGIAPAFHKHIRSRICQKRRRLAWRRATRMARVCAAFCENLARSSSSAALAFFVVW
jgi:hypothetical protein